MRWAVVEGPEICAPVLHFGVTRQSQWRRISSPELS